MGWASEVAGWAAGAAVDCPGPEAGVVASGDWANALAVPMAASARGTSENARASERGKKVLSSSTCVGGLSTIASLHQGWKLTILRLGQLLFHVVDVWSVGELALIESEIRLGARLVANPAAAQGAAVQGLLVGLTRTR